MKGLIISNYQIGHNQYKIDRFKEEAINLGVSLDVIFNDGTLFTIDKGLVKENIPECDFIIYLDNIIEWAYGAMETHQTSDLRIAGSIPAMLVFFFPLFFPRLSPYPPIPIFFFERERSSVGRA